MEEYQPELFDTYLHQLMTLAVVIRDIPTDKMVEAIENAETVGPLFHPSEYLQANEGNKLRAMRDFVRAADEFREEVFKILRQQLGAKK